MKTIALTLIAFLFLVPTMKGQDKEIKGLLDNEKSRTEIFNTIQNDHQLMTEFLNKAETNDHAMMMMKNHNSMHEGSMGNMHGNDESHMMHGSEGTQMMHGSGDNQGMMQGSGTHSEMMHQMMGMMKEDPELMPEMMDQMMNMCPENPEVCDHMAEVMSQHPKMMKMGMDKMNPDAKKSIQ